MLSSSKSVKCLQRWFKDTIGLYEDIELKGLTGYCNSLRRRNIVPWIETRGVFGGGAAGRVVIGGGGAGRVVIGGGGAGRVVIGGGGAGRVVIGGGGAGRVVIGGGGAGRVVIGGGGAGRVVIGGGGAGRVVIGGGGGEAGLVVIGGGGEAVLGNVCEGVVPAATLQLFGSGIWLKNLAYPAISQQYLFIFFRRPSKL